MAQTADVVIVGGGVVGCSTGFQLRRDGFAGRILMIERDPSYSRASSSLAMGGIRQQFEAAVNIHMVQYSVAFYERFDELLGADPARTRTGFHQRGYLFLADEAASDRLERRFERQRELGAVVEKLDHDTLRRRLPGVFLDDITFGVFGPKDGYANPPAVFAAFRAVAAGARVERLHGEVTGIRHRKGQVVGVKVGNGEDIDAPVVVNAAGPYAASVARLAGIELPVSPVRQHLFRAELPERWPVRFPMLVDPGGVHWRHDDFDEGAATPDRIVAARTKMDEPPGEKFACDARRWTDEFLPDLARRVPAFARLKLVEGWAGLYEMTPDHNPIIGEHPEMSGFFLANGFSGHGLMMAPATGKVLSELIRLGRAETVDIGPFSVERFARGELLWDEATI